MADSLHDARAQGLETLDELLGGKSDQSTRRFEGQALSPAVLASSKGLLFLKTWRAGLVAGVAHGSGFLIARTPRGSWSAPCFVNLTRFELGAIAGVERVLTLMAAITRKGVETVAAGKTQVFGSDVTIQLWPFSKSSGPQDEIDVAGFGIGSDWVTASVGRGLIFEFALTNGTLSVDNTLNGKVYGKEVSADDILHGKIERPTVMEPVYRRIAEAADRVDA